MEAANKPAGTPIRIFASFRFNPSVPNKILAYQRSAHFFISPEEKQWVLTDWIMLASQSTVLKLAVVVSENYNTLINATDFTSQGQQMYQKHGAIEYQVFMDFASARTCYCLMRITDFEFGALKLLNLGL